MAVNYGQYSDLKVSVEDFKSFKWSVMVKPWSGSLNCVLEQGTQYLSPSRSTVKEMLLTSQVLELIPVSVA